MQNKQKYILIVLGLLIFIGLVYGIGFRLADPVSQTSVAPQLKGFTPQAVPNGNQAVYDIAFTIDSSGYLDVQAQIKITNLSEDDWESLVFYFIPNMFTQENRVDGIAHFNQVDIQQINRDGQVVDFLLEKDTLTVYPDSVIKPKQTSQVEISYSMTLPLQGHRLELGDEGNFFLAQWYPMLATYQEGRWNKEPYVFSNAETYHTDFSAFTITYTIPEGYALFSSADQDAPLGQTSGQLTMSDIKEIYIAIMKEPRVATVEVMGTEIRAIANEADERYLEYVLEVAEDVFRFYSEQIGPYPYQQLDIIMDQRFMEYPGIVTVGSSKEHKRLDWWISSIAHEIAHQWFYATVSNDPYHEAWLDEGLVTFMTSQFTKPTNRHAQNNQEHFQTEPRQRITYDHPMNLPIRSFSTYSTVYQQPGNMLKAFMDERHLEEQDILDFLSAYYHTYRFKQVDSAEFVRFAMAYFELEDDAFFREWLRY